MVMGKKQHLFPVFQQRAHKLAHIGRLGHSRGPARLLGYAVLQNGPLGRREALSLLPAQQLGQHRFHKPGVYTVVPVQLLHQAALGRQLAEHILLHPAEHQPLPAQVRAQELRLGHNGVAIAPAPLPGKALPVAQKMIIQNIDHVPDFPAPVVNGRA